MSAVPSSLLSPPLPGTFLQQSPTRSPEIIHRSGCAATFAAQEFFLGTIRNEHKELEYVEEFARGARGELRRPHPG
jgi:hypothetical protein